MGAYVLNRLWQAVLVLFAVSVLSFVLIFLSGDPIAALVPLNARQSDITELRHAYHLDQPIPVQYVLFLDQAVHGNFGESFQYRTDAMGVVLGALPNTALLAFSSLALSSLIAVPLGMVAAWRRGSRADFGITLLSLLSISMPSFWLGVILILVFAGTWHLFPASGAGGWTHLVLPTITVSAFSVGLLIRLVRRSAADVLRQAYVVTAHGKGLGSGAIAWRHVLRNSAIPVVTVLGLQFGSLLGGTAVVETVFAWPGIGWLMVESIGSRDLPVIRAAVLVIAVFVVLVNLAVDLLYTVLDPRIGVRSGT